MESHERFNFTAQKLIAFARRVQECAYLVRLLIQRSTIDFLNRLEPRRRHRHELHELENETRITRIRERDTNYTNYHKLIRLGKISVNSWNSCLMFHVSCFIEQLSSTPANRHRN